MKPDRNIAVYNDLKITPCGYLRENSPEATKSEVHNSYPPPGREPHPGLITIGIYHKNGILMRTVRSEGQGIFSPSKTGE
jgi:hypothetical protein